MTKLPESSANLGQPEWKRDYRIIRLVCFEAKILSVKYNAISIRHESPKLSKIVCLCKFSLFKVDFFWPTATRGYVKSKLANQTKEARAIYCSKNRGVLQSK